MCLALLDAPFEEYEVARILDYIGILSREAYLYVGGQAIKHGPIHLRQDEEQDALPCSRQRQASR